MKPHFCNRCHKEIKIPKMLLGGNIVSANAIKVGCGDANCSKNGGHCKFTPPKKEAVEEIKTEVVSD